MGRQGDEASVARRVGIAVFLVVARVLVVVSFFLFALGGAGGDELLIHGEQMLESAARVGEGLGAITAVDGSVMRGRNSIAILSSYRAKG